jgi:hypothetical protein
MVATKNGGDADTDAGEKIALATGILDKERSKSLWRGNIHTTNTAADSSK